MYCSLEVSKTSLMRPSSGCSCLKNHAPIAIRRTANKKRVISLLFSRNGMNRLLRKDLKGKPSVLISSMLQKLHKCTNFGNKHNMLIIKRTLHHI